MTFTIEQLEALKEGTTPAPWHAVTRAQAENEGGHYSLYAEVHDQEGFPLMYAEDAFVYHREANFYLAASSPALLDQLIATKKELQRVQKGIEELRDSYMEDSGTVGSTQEEQIELDAHGDTAKILTEILEGNQ